MSLHMQIDEATGLVARECIDCARAVHRSLGPGYGEGIYRRSMVMKMSARGLLFEEERVVQIEYRGAPVGRQRIDLICGGLVVVELKTVELKTVEQIERVHVSQLVSHLHATGLRLGLSMNFRVAALKHGLRCVVV